MTTVRFIFVGLAFSAAAAASADLSLLQLVTNGSFEAASPSNGWTQSSPDHSIIGDWSGQAPVSTNQAFFGGYNNALDVLSQTIHTQAHFSSAVLEFDLTIHQVDFENFDFLEVKLGDTVVERIDLGNNDRPDSFITRHLIYDVSWAMDGTSKLLSFKGTTDTSLASEVYVDNISLTAAVPEPATMSALALGAVALLRRRRRA